MIVRPEKLMRLEMQKSEYTFILDKKQNAPRIPKTFEPTLRSILQHEYVAEHKTLPEVRDSIRREHNINVEVRQLTYRITKYGMVRRDHQDHAQVLMDGEGNVQQPNSSSISEVSESHGPANLHINQVSTPYPGSPFDFGFSSHDDHSEPLQAMESMQSPQCNGTSESTLSSPTQPESFAVDVEDITMTEGDENTPAMIEREIHLVTSTQLLSDRHEDNEQGEPPLGQSFSSFGEIIPDVSGFAETLNELDPSTEQLLSNGVIPGEPSIGGQPISFQGMIVKRTDDPCASMSASIEKAKEILGPLVKGAGQASNQLDMSTVDTSSSTRLAIVMLCCGHNDDASCCLEFLLWYWSAQGLPSFSTTTTVDPFLQSTNILTRLLQTSLCGANDVTCFRLWRSCRRAHEERSRWIKDNHAFTFQQILAIGQLALAAYSQGYNLLFEDLRKFWAFDEDVASIKWPSKKVNSSVRAAFKYIDRRMTNPSSIDALSSWVITKHESLIARIKKLLIWIQKQLLLYSISMQYGEDSSEETWCRVIQRKDASCLEQQLLLSYLSYQGSKENLSWKLWLDNEDQNCLPWQICLEWLLGDFPYLTLTLLSSLVKCKGDVPSDTTSSGNRSMRAQIWCTRMLDAVNTLLEDIQGTSKRFYAVAAVSCPETIPITPTSPGHRTIWTSPVKLDTSNNSTTSEDDLHGQTRHLVRNTTLFGGIVPVTTQERASVMAFEYQDPTLLDTPRSSLSGFESMRSIYMRAMNHINRSRTSLSTCSSLYLRRFSLSESILTNGLLGSLMSRSQQSIRMSSWSSLSNSLQAERISTVPNDNTMDLDG